MIKNKNILLLTALLLFNFCSGSEIPKRTPDKIEAELFEQELNAEPLGTDCWINLMPNSEERFFFSGKISIKPSVNYDFENIGLKKIIIEQKKKIIFEISPLVQEDTYNGKRIILYSTIKGLIVNPNLNPEQTIDAILVFAEGSDEYKYIISGIKIEKVY